MGDAGPAAPNTGGAGAAAGLATSPFLHATRQSSTNTHAIFDWLFMARGYAQQDAVSSDSRRATRESDTAHGLDA